MRNPEEYNTWYGYMKARPNPFIRIYFKDQLSAPLTPK